MAWRSAANLLDPFQTSLQGSNVACSGSKGLAGSSEENRQQYARRPPHGLAQLCRHRPAQRRAVCQRQAVACGQQSVSRSGNC